MHFCNKDILIGVIIDFWGPVMTLAKDLINSLIHYLALWVICECCWFRLAMDCKVGPLDNGNNDNKNKNNNHNPSYRLSYFFYFFILQITMSPGRFWFVMREESHRENRIILWQALQLINNVSEQVLGTTLNSVYIKVVQIVTGFFSRSFMFYWVFQ